MRVGGHKSGAGGDEAHDRARLVQHEPVPLLPDRHLAVRMLRQKLGRLLLPLTPIQLRAGRDLALSRRRARSGRNGHVAVVWPWLGARRGVMNGRRAHQLNGEQEKAEFPDGIKF